MHSNPIKTQGLDRLPLANLQSLGQKLLVPAPLGEKPVVLGLSLLHKAAVHRAALVMFVYS